MLHPASPPPGGPAEPSLPLSRPRAPRVLARALATGGDTDSQPVRKRATLWGSDPSGTGERTAGEESLTQGDRTPSGTRGRGAYTAGAEEGDHGKKRRKVSLLSQQCDSARNLEWLKTVKESHGSVELTSLSLATAINEKGCYIIRAPADGQKVSHPTSRHCCDLYGLLSLGVGVVGGSASRKPASALALASRSPQTRFYSYPFPRATEAARRRETSLWKSSRSF